MREQLNLESLNNSWSKCYEQEASRVITALGHCTEGGLIWRMAHVGSTALKVVPAQACIDILLDVYPVPLDERSVRALESLGYQALGNSSFENCEVFMRCNDASTLAYKLFISTVEYGHWSNMLVLRDYLKFNLETANEYTNLKLEFSHKSKHRVSYEDAKENFFKSILAKAYEWHIETTGFKPIINLAEELSELEIAWHISGGWALDLFLSTANRFHDDIDLSFERQHHLELQAFLLKKHWTLHFIDEAKSVLWDKNHVLPIHIYQIHARKGQDFIDILVEPDGKHNWRYRRDEQVSLDKKKAILYWQQIPFLAPEAVLLFKAKVRDKKPREKDSIDFLRVLPFLSIRQKNWLKKNIQLETADHPWLFDL